MNPENQAENRNPDGTFKEGVSGNPAGRPKGKSLKEFARDYLMSLSDEAKIEYMEKLPKDIVWKMAEGNPANATDLTSRGEKILIMPAELINKNDSSQNTENSSS
jgi:hypothetical protein